MSADFDEYFLSIPKPLSNEEQESLFLEYRKTKDERIKNKIIEHNLRLCGKVASDYFGKIQYTSFEELYSECCACLLTAVDEYNPNSSNSSFSYFAINLMKKKMFRIGHECSLRKAYSTDPVALNNDGEEVDVFNLIGCEDSCKFVKDLEESEFIQEVENYIDNNIDEKWRNILKMYLGINNRQHSMPELVKITGLSKQRLNIKIKQLIEGIKCFVIKKDPLLKEINNKLDKEQIHEKLFNEYYGLNGSKIYSDKELEQKYGFKYAHSTIDGIERKYIKSGKYTIEMIKELKKAKKERKHNDTMRFYAYCYNSFYGLNEHERKSMAELAFEFNHSLSGIELAIKTYKNYLKNQSGSTQENLAKKDVSQM